MYAELKLFLLFSIPCPHAPDGSVPNSLGIMSVTDQGWQKYLALTHLYFSFSRTLNIAKARYFGKQNSDQTAVSFKARTL